MKTRIPESLFMPLIFQMGLFAVCYNEEELAETIVYQLSDEMDALLDDDDIREISAKNMAAIVGGVLSACGAYNIHTKSSSASPDVGRRWPHYSIWFSFTTSPFRSFRHTDYINISVP